MVVNWIILGLFLSALVDKGFTQFDDSAGGDDDAPTEESEYHQPGQASDSCLCVSFAQCEDGQVVTDGSFMMDPRRKPTNNSLEEDWEDYKSEDVEVCGPYHVCCTDPEASTIKPYVHHCGTRNPTGVNARILTSNEDGESEFGEWPWQAIILRKEGNEFAMKCGATLIDKKHVLTVAHCAEEFRNDMDNMVVRLGEWDTHSLKEFMPHEDIPAIDVVIHPNYNKRNLENDIAIVELADEVSFKPHIETICLPKPDDDFSGKRCVVTGWGTDAFAEGDYTAILKEIVVPVLEKGDCQKRLRKTRLGRYFKLHEGFICAGGEKGVDSCTGDGGGPLACMNNDKTYTLVGLVAWGVECGMEGIPGVYMNLRKYTNWISDVLETPPDYYYPQ